MTFLYLGMFGGLILWTSLVGKDYFSPVRLYLIVYAFYLAINSLQLSRLQAPWSPTTDLFFWGASFLYVGAGVVIFLFDKVLGGKELDFGQVRQSLAEEAQGLDWHWFKKVFTCCAAVFILSYAGAAAIIGTIPVFAKVPETARIAFFQASLPTGMGMFFGPLSLMLGIELLFFGKGSKRDRWAVALTMGVVMLLYLTIAMRLDLFRFFVFAIVLYHYGRRKLGLKQFVMLAVAGVGVFIAIFLARSHGNAFQQLNEMAQVKMPKKYFWASQIYAYVVSNFWNMDYGFVRYEDGLGMYPTSWGFELFRPIMFLLQLEPGMQTAYGFDSIFNDSVNMVRGMNSTVYLWHFWKDFGAFGVYFLTLAASLALAIFYRNTTKYPTLFRLCLWGIFSGMIIFSLTAALWEFWFTYLDIGIIAMAHYRPKFL